MQSLSSTHQLRYVEKDQKWSPKPKITSTMPKIFIKLADSTTIESLIIESAHTKIANKKRLIIAPVGPMPNIFLSLF